MGLFALPLLIIVFATTDSITLINNKRKYKKYKQEQRRRLGVQ